VHAAAARAPGVATAADAADVADAADAADVADVAGAVRARALDAGAVQVRTPAPVLVPAEAADRVRSHQVARRRQTPRRLPNSPALAPTTRIYPGL
jgi:hypothetical protein